MSIKLLSLFHGFWESDLILGSVAIINTQLIDTGSCIPEFALTNAMLEQMVDTSDEWIVKRTGVRERRIARNTRTWELALGAAQNALADAGITAEELDLLLVSTCTPDTNTVSYTHLDVYKRQEQLRKVDEVAYVRFASVYRQFKDINTFMEELNTLIKDK